ncbi:DoxX family protein [Nocardioides sp. Iso805N]|uniref:DoxX family protein n=1 Tax=Nocardioides sp. Iso805N TaxID=1283287 RepID=UPI000372172D|nr:DoxX family protein [Nocardioides sp. Iso805N]
MTISRTIARPLLASIFVVGPINTLRNSSGAAKKAELVTDPLIRLAQRAGIPIPQNPETLVKINAGVQLAAGLCLATGRFPRLSAAVLATSLVPTTVVGHDFWNESDPAVRRQQQIQLAKNLSLLGGLIIAAGDTDGKPGVAWLAKHAVGDVKREIGHKASTAKLEGKVAALEAEVGVGALGTALVAAGQHAKDAIVDAAHQAATSDTTQNLADRASDLASSLAETAKERGPVVAAAARDQIASFAQAARDEAGPVIEDWGKQAKSTSKDLRKQAKKAAKDARKNATPVIEDWRKQAKKAAKDARKNATPVIEDWRKQAKSTSKDLRKQAKKAQKQARKQAPVVAAAAREQAAAVAEAAREQAAAVADAAKAKIA